MVSSSPRLLTVITFIIFGLIITFAMAFPAHRSLANNAGYALAFDGVNDLVKLSATSLMLHSNWRATKTVNLWVKPMGNAPICQYNSVAWCDSIFGDRPRWWGIVRGIVGNQDRIWIWNYDGTFRQIGIEYTVGEWVNIALVQDQGLLRAYKNGLLVGIVMSGPTLQPNTGAFPELYLGGIINNSSRNWTFEGEIDEVRLWNRALSAEEITQDMFLTLSGNEPDLAAYYSMSNGAGLALTDDSIASWDGVLLDGLVDVPPNGSPPQWVVSGAFESAPPTPTDLVGTATETIVVPSETPAITPSFTATATATPTPVPTQTPQESPTPTATETETTTPTVVFSDTPTFTPTETPDIPPTPTDIPPSDTPTPLPVDTATPTPPFTPTSSPTALPTSSIPALQEYSGILTPGDAYDVAVDGNYAYVADVGGGMRIIDISNPFSPVEVAAFNQIRRTYGVTVEAGLAYLADGPTGLHIVDVSNPLQPVEIGMLDTPGYAWEVEKNGSLLFIADRMGGLRIVDVTNSTAPVEISSYLAPGEILDLAIANNFAFVAALQSGLRVLDISNPALPIEVGVFNQNSQSFGVTLSGNMAYLADGTNGLKIIDVSNPFAPQFLGRYDTPASSRDVKVFGQYAFITDWSPFIYMVDISNPQAPYLLSQLNTLGKSREIFVNAQILYLAAYEGGLRIVGY